MAAGPRPAGGLKQSAALGAPRPPAWSRLRALPGSSGMRAACAAPPPRLLSQIPPTSPLSVPCAPRGGPLGGLWRFRRALLHSGPPRGAAGPQRACSGVCCAPVAAVAGEPPASFTTPAGRSARVEPCSGYAAALALRPRARCALLVRRGAPALAGPPTPAKCRRSSASGGEKGRAGALPLSRPFLGPQSAPACLGCSPSPPATQVLRCPAGVPLYPPPVPPRPLWGQGGKRGVNRPDCNKRTIYAILPAAAGTAARLA